MFRINVSVFNSTQIFKVRKFGPNIDCGYMYLKIFPIDKKIFYDFPVSYFIKHIP